MKANMKMFLEQTIEGLLTRRGVKPFLIYFKIKYFGAGHKDHYKVFIHDIEFCITLLETNNNATVRTIEIGIAPHATGYCMKVSIEVSIYTTKAGALQFSDAKDYGKLNTMLQHAIAYAVGISQTNLE